MQNKKQKLIEFIHKELKLHKSYIMCEEFGISGQLTTGEKLYKTKSVKRLIISLSDVLRVIQKKSNDGMIKTDTHWGISHIDEVRDKLLNSWNLEKDFNNQSEEFYNWLYNLLELDK